MMTTAICTANKVNQAALVTPLYELRSSQCHVRAFPRLLRDLTWTYVADRRTIARVPTVKDVIGDTSSVGSNPKNTTAAQPSRGLKHQLSSASESSTDSEEESLPLADVVARLDKKYPRLSFPQYLPILKRKGIVYAESVGGFDTEYYVGLGMAEGAVGAFISGVKRALKSEKEKKKRVKYFDKGNKMKQEESVEI